MPCHNALGKPASTYADLRAEAWTIPRYEKKKQQASKKQNLLFNKEMKNKKSLNAFQHWGNWSRLCSMPCNYKLTTVVSAKYKQLWTFTCQMPKILLAYLNIIVSYISAGCCNNANCSDNPNLTIHYAQCTWAAVCVVFYCAHKRILCSAHIPGMHSVKHEVTKNDFLTPSSTAILNTCCCGNSVACHLPIQLLLAKWMVKKILVVRV